MFGSSGTPGRANSFPLEDDRSAGASIPESSIRESGSAMAAALQHSGGSGNGNGTGNGSPSPTEEKGNTTTSTAGGNNGAPDSPATEKRRRSSGIAKMGGIFSSAKNSLHLGQGSNSTDKLAQSPMQRLSKHDPALGVPQGSNNNSAGESVPGPKSTFRVGVTEDKNKKCRRTMEDTHAYLYNFLSTPSPALGASDTGSSKGARPSNDSGNVSTHSDKVVETDNGYFAIFDGHAGTFAADWCGKKLHLVLEDTIRQNPNTPIPELLDQTFTQVDQQLEKLPLKNSGCTAVIAVLRWEDRVPNNQSATGSALLAPAAAAAAAAKPEEASAGNDAAPPTTNTAANESSPELKLKESATRQRVLYTANVGDARIVLCRSGRALRLSYDHKGSDENEGRRVANAGGLILNNRVNGVLAVTRALGDAYMKDLVTGHPYTTETVIQPEQDEFLILACDGLWDVCSDQEAVDLVRHDHDPQLGSKKLVEHALARFSTDNLSCMIVRFDNRGIQKLRAEHNIGVEGDKHTAPGGVTEADAIVAETKRVLEETGQPPGSGVPAARAGDPIIAEQPEAEERAAAAEAVPKSHEPGPELNADVLRKAQQKAKEGQQAASS